MTGRKYQSILACDRCRVMRPCSYCAADPAAAERGGRWLCQQCAEPPADIEALTAASGMPSVEERREDSLRAWRARATAKPAAGKPEGVAEARGRSHRSSGPSRNVDRNEQLE